MLRTMAQWIARPATVDTGPAAPPVDADEPLDTAAGLAYCMGNEELYRRLLAGFQESEARFVTEVRSAIAEQRWADAGRRAHDMKGLSGTIGAHRLLAATLGLQTALGAQQPAPTEAAVARAAAELDRVLERIATILANS